jgi:hypothetical protein
MVADPVLDEPSCRPELSTSWAEPLSDEVLQKFLGPLDPPPRTFGAMHALNAGRSHVCINDVPEERVGELQRRYCFVDLGETDLPARHFFSASGGARVYLSRQVLMRVRPIKEGRYAIEVVSFNPNLEIQPLGNHMTSYR